MTMFSHVSSHILMTKIILYVVHGVKMMFGIKQDLYLEREQGKHYIKHFNVH